MLVDAHCHFNSLPNNIRIKVADWFRASGNKLVDSSIDFKTSQESIRLSKKYSFLYNSLGFHPFSCGDFSFDLYNEYKSILEKENKIVAIGEIGLDYKAKAPLARQEEVLRKWLGLAKEKGLTALIHHRLNKDSWSDSLSLGRPRILTILDDYFGDYRQVVFHCFSYSFDFLKQIIDKGGVASFSLNILRNNKKIIDSLKKCPVDNLILETDSPYMKVKANPSSPLDIKSVYSYVSELKNISQEKLKDKVLANAERIFGKMS